MQLFQTLIKSVFIIFAMWVMLIEYSFQKMEIKKPENFQEVWGHRGHCDNSSIQENSIQSYKNAINKGAKGIEIDVFFDSELKKFVVSHDFPYKLQKVNQKILLLDSVFKTFNTTTKYWLDLKNLNLKNIENIISEMDSLQNRYHISEKIYVETGQIREGIALSKKGINTLLWVQYGREWYTAGLKKLIIKFALVSGKFKGITTAHKYYDDDFIKTFHKIPCYLFHISNEKNIKYQFQNHQNIAVFLVDSPVFKIFK